MSQHGGLPPRRPDQHQQATPRGVAPGSRATQVTNSKTSALTVQVINKPGTPVNTQIINAPGVPVVTQDGGVAGMASASTLQVGPQAATTFKTFTADSRIWAAHLSLAVGSNASYAASVTQIYALIKTSSGIVLAVIELAVSGPAQQANGDADLAIPGIAVANGDHLQLDVNNNVGLGTGGLIRASTTVMYSTP